MPVTGQVNLHLDYSHPLTEHTSIEVGWDFFNIMNKRTLQYQDQNIDLGFGTPNPDYQKPALGAEPYHALFQTFQRPFHMRGVVRFMF